MLVVWEAGPKVEGIRLLVLLSLADWADDDGNVLQSRASLKRLARRLRRSVRQTQRVLHDVEGKGWLEVTSSPGRQNVYRIRLDVLQALGAPEDKGGDTPVVTPDADVTPDTLDVTPDADVTPDTLDVTPTPDADGVVGGVTSRVSRHIPVLPEHTTTTARVHAESTSSGGDQDLILPSWPTWSPNLQEAVRDAIAQAPADLRQQLADELVGALLAGRNIPNPVGWLRAIAARWQTAGPTPEYAFRVAANRSAAADPQRDPNRRLRISELASNITGYLDRGQPELAAHDLEELHELAPDHPLVAPHAHPRKGATA